MTIDWTIWDTFCAKSKLWVNFHKWTIAYSLPDFMKSLSWKKTAKTSSASSWWWNTSKLVFLISYAAMSWQRISWLSFSTTFCVLSTTSIPQTSCTEILSQTTFWLQAALMLKFAILAFQIQRLNIPRKLLTCLSTSLTLIWYLRRKHLVRLLLQVPKVWTNLNQKRKSTKGRLLHTCLQDGIEALNFVSILKTTIQKLIFGPLDASFMSSNQFFRVLQRCNHNLTLCFLKENLAILYLHTEMKMET